MRIDWNRRYTTIAVYAFIVIICSMLFLSGLNNISIVKSQFDILSATLQPFVIGAVLAYLLNFILNLYEDKLLVGNVFETKISRKGKRGIGIILTYLTAGFIMYLFIQFVLPQLVDSLVGLANDIPGYVNDLNKILDQLMQELEIEPEYMTIATEKWEDFVDIVIQVVTNLVPVLGGALKTVGTSIWNIILGIIISIYLLLDKENFYALSKKMTYGIFNRQNADKILELTHRSNDTFGKFLSGKIIDSAIIGVLTYVVLTIFKMPYILLISVIIGITNIIPFFGPFFGAIPATIIILFVDPVKALWFILIIIVIQQLDGNVIGPKILGDSIGISAFWILFSLLVAGKILGLTGMIIGVPLFAIIYSIIKDIIEANLRKKGMPVETEGYMEKYKK